MVRFAPGTVLADRYRIVRFLARGGMGEVCRVYDVGEVDGRHFLSMEYVDGEDLASRLGRAGLPAVGETLEICRQLCRGLAAVHDEGILHRDLKPANILLDRHSRVRITDFGIAAPAGDIEETVLRRGTPAYMAPELRTGGEPSVRSDLYALGLVMYECLTGRRAFGEEPGEEPIPLSDLVDDVDPAVEEAVLQCLASW